MREYFVFMAFSHTFSQFTQVHKTQTKMPNVHHWKLVAPFRRKCENWKNIFFYAPHRMVCCFFFRRLSCPENVWEVLIASRLQSVMQIHRNATMNVCDKSSTYIVQHIASSRFRVRAEYIFALGAPLDGVLAANSQRIVRGQMSKAHHSIYC